jgi:hypothetical protein
MALETSAATPALVPLFFRSSLIRNLCVDIVSRRLRPAVIVQREFACWPQYKIRQRRPRPCAHSTPVIANNTSRLVPSPDPVVHRKTTADTQH